MKNFFNRLARTLGSEKALNIINSSSDIILALFIIVLIGMIIIPVTPGILDNLIAINMTASIGVLMVALYIPKAVHLSIFPSLLLITTLFRLGIEISATRQILLHADAGHIIFPFSNFFIGFIYGAGATVFLIFSPPQFFSVPKGAERVAGVE